MNLDGTYGFLYVDEWSHMGQDKDVGYEWALENGMRECDEVFDFLIEHSTVVETMIKPYEVYIGEKTGFGKCHEHCIFFPVGTSDKNIKIAMKTYEGYIYLKASEKWDSFLKSFV